MNIKRCEMCNCLLPEDEEVREDKVGLFYCERCWEEETFECECCGWHWNVSEMEGEDICWRCYEEDYEED